MGSESEPRLRVIWTDPVTGRKGYAVIDRMVNGLAGGGTRMRSGVTIEEVERLARTMSYKNGAFNLPGGGAKGGVDIDPHDPEARGLLSRYVRAMRPLYRNGWGTAEDLGISQELLNEVFAEQGVGMTVQAMLDRSGDPEAGAGESARALPSTSRASGSPTASADTAWPKPLPRPPSTKDGTSRSSAPSCRASARWAARAPGIWPGSGPGSSASSMSTAR